MLAPVGISIANALGANPQAIVLGDCNRSRLLLPDTDRIRNKSDHDDLYKIEIPGFCKIWLAAADHLLDLMYRDPSAGIPILLTEMDR